MCNCMGACMCKDLSSGVCSQPTARLLFPPSGPIKRPRYSLDEGVMFNWRAGLKLITLLTPGTHCQLEIDLSARAWFANELPLVRPSPSPFPPLPRLPPSLFFFFLLWSIWCQDHLFVLCHDRCCAGLPLFPISFSGTTRRAKRFPHVILTPAPPPVQSIALFFVYQYSNLQSFGVGWNAGDCHCLHLNNGEVFLWLGKVLIGRYEKAHWLLRKPQGNWLLSVSPFCFFFCLCPSLPLCNKLKRSQFL